MDQGFSEGVNKIILTGNGLNYFHPETNVGFFEGKGDIALFLNAINHERAGV
jgi:hypothetical protein